MRCGAVLGAGAAFTGDFLFMTSLRGDKKISRDEMRLIRSAGTMVWVGIVLSFISGSFLVYINGLSLFESSGFLVKMTIFSVIVINGLVFHLWHMPFLEKLWDSDDFSPTRYNKNRLLLMFVSGGISVSSWISVLIIPYIRSILSDYSYGMIML